MVRIIGMYGDNLLPRGLGIEINLCDYNTVGVHFGVVAYGHLTRFTTYIDDAVGGKLPDARFFY